MYSTQTPTEPFAGTVAVANEFGFKLEGDQDWTNYGKFYKGPRPNQGDAVKGQKRGKYVSSMEVSAGSRVAPAATAQKSGGFTSDPLRERRIATLALYKANVEIAVAQGIPTDFEVLRATLITRTVQALKDIEEIVDGQYGDLESEPDFSEPGEATYS